MIFISYILSRFFVYTLTFFRDLRQTADGKPSLDQGIKFFSRVSWGLLAILVIEILFEIFILNVNMRSI